MSESGSTDRQINAKRNALLLYKPLTLGEVPRTRGRGCMKSTQITKNNELLDNAKKLRQNMTPQEKRLWYEFLRDYPVKIYRQRIIEDYVVDFYCYKARLVIEIDGGAHFTPDGKSYDKARNRVLSRLDLHVMRFSNSQIDTEFESVCKSIDEFIKWNCCE